MTTDDQITSTLFDKLTGLRLNPAFFTGTEVIHPSERRAVVYLLREYETNPAIGLARHGMTLKAQVEFLLNGHETCLAAGRSPVTRRDLAALLPAAKEYTRPKIRHLNYVSAGYGAITGALTEGLLLATHRTIDALHVAAVVGMASAGWAYPRLVEALNDRLIERPERRSALRQQARCVDDLLTEYGASRDRAVAREEMLATLGHMEEAYESWPAWKKAQRIDAKPQPLEGNPEPHIGVARETSENKTNVNPSGADPDAKK
jgi:hypothetical protein